jgi:hypothetical protein
MVLGDTLEATALGGACPWGVLSCPSVREAKFFLKALGHKLPVSIYSCQLSAVSLQPSAFSRQLLAFSSQRPAPSFRFPCAGSQLSAPIFRLPGTGSQLSAPSCWLPAAGSQLSGLQKTGCFSFFGGGWLVPYLAFHF